MSAVNGHGGGGRTARGADSIGPAPMAWVRYSPGGTAAITDTEVETWAPRCRVAIFDAWESAAAERLKLISPAVTVLCRKDLATVDEAEPGPVYSSGVSPEQVRRNESWFAVDRAGDRVGWGDPPGRWQMRAWDPAYRDAWVSAVTAELEGSPFDGVLTVGDIEETPRLDLPLPDLGSTTQQREANDDLIAEAGGALRDIGKILVASVGDARRSPRRWAKLSAWGGVLEPAWLSTVGGRILDPGTARQQTERLSLAGPDAVPADPLVVVRTPVQADAPDADDLTGAGESMVRYGLAAYWVFGGGRGVYGASSPDGSRSHWIPEMAWDLGEPIQEPECVVNLWTRTFTKGRAVVNLASDGRRRRHVTLPSGYVLPDGSEPPTQMVLGAHEGLVLRRDF
ncbi:putative glycoside hydrolase [Kocuria coralli]|nr:putative glycoside hydrolase [Kocuria coralli]